MDKRPKILVVGSLVMDLVVRTGRVPNEGETVKDNLSFSTAPGGKGANQAVQAARLGADVTMVGKVGSDIFGDQLINSLNESGVGTRNILRENGVSSGVGDIILEVKEGQKARNRIIVVPGANMRITVEDISFLQDTISQYDMVMMQNEIPTEIDAEVTYLAYERGIPSMLNPAPSGKFPDSMISKLAYISPNEHEASDMTGVRLYDTDGGIDIDAVKKAAAYLLRMGVGNVVITLGSRGVAFMNKDKFLYKPCIDIVDVIDPTAAGDSFVGAFCTALSVGKTEEEALDFANYAATITVSRMGAQPSLPYLNEVTELMGANRSV